MSNRRTTARRKTPAKVATKSEPAPAKPALVAEKVSAPSPPPPPADGYVRNGIQITEKMLRAGVDRLSDMRATKSDHFCLVREIFRAMREAE